MKRSTVLFGSIAVFGFFSDTPTATAQILPSDAMPTAAVPADTFASWFASGKPSLNGLVKPADSVNFGSNEKPGVDANIKFYNWSEQMFLWITSPVGGGADTRVMTSPTFFIVSEINEKGERVLRPQKPGVVQQFATRIAQVGPNGFPVILNKAGKMFEVVPQAKKQEEQKLILNAEGRSVLYDTFSLDAGRKAIFRDADGNVISKAHPNFPSHLMGNRFVRLHKTATESVFLNETGDVLDIGVGQADFNGVLLAQNGSLVYYNTLFNDVMAYFLTENRRDQIAKGELPVEGVWPTNGKQFPTTHADLDKIVAFAKTQDATLPDAVALTVEVKASWVEAESLKNSGEYILIDAIIPTFDKSDPKQWLANGEKRTKLAMVGLHFVGSVKGHPEMIWATFEHTGNTPLGTYKYNATTGTNPKEVPRNTAGSWVFCASNATENLNALFQSVSSSDPLTIKTVNDQNAIAPNNVSLVNAFGAALDVAPNPHDTYAESNTQIISINNSVRSQLAQGDVRANYFFVGSTWTKNGEPPTEAYPNGNVVGTSQLSNSTMETFQQAQGNNCFTCHTTNTTRVSHVYSRLLPLPLKKP